jgi:YD repeat-containing protein
MLRPCREFLSVSWAVALLQVAVPIGLRGQSPATLQASYDDSGRLTNVVDPGGNVTTYTYDAIGNMLSITQSTLSSPTALAIFNFTPQQGVVGSTITIQGQSFSPTASADTVQVGGITASVVSATTTTLTVTVPSGAATGQIKVTVGGATATTAGNFTVLQVPSITSISFTSVLQGATVSNFQVSGFNLTGATFSFAPAFVPPAITIPPSSVNITPGGTSATMTLTVAANAVGSLTLVATNPSQASSSPLPLASDTLAVISSNLSADTDGDGLTNIYEAAIGTNPLISSTANDGIPDGWAVFFGLNPLLSTGGGNTAPDGMTYLQAYQGGLNPLLPVGAPPTVSSVFPANGATGYPTDGVIVVRFGVPLQAPVTPAAVQSAINAGLPPGSSFSTANAAAAAVVLQAFLLGTCCGAAVSGTVQLSQGNQQVPGTVVLSNDGLSLVFVPAQALSPSTTYTVSVQKVPGLSGIQMTGTYQSSFTTGPGTNSTAGGSVLTSPPNDATGVPTNAVFTVQFSQQVDSSTVTAQSFFLTDTVTKQTLPGTLNVDPAGFTVSFVPQQPYGVGRLISATLTSGILYIAHNPFAGALLSFTTGFGSQTQGPELLGASPANGADGVPVNSLVVVQFNEPLSAVSAAAGLQLQQGGIPVSGTAALSTGNTRFIFTPASLLAPGADYTIAITSQATDVAGNPVTVSGSPTFRTGAVGDPSFPSVTAVGPANGASGVPTNSVIQLQFSKPVDPLTVTTSDFTVYPSPWTSFPIPGTIAVSTDGMTATFTPITGLDPFTTYGLEMDSGVTDLEGNIPRGFSSGFTTGFSAAPPPLTVSQVSPPNGANPVPLNPLVQLVQVVLSAPVSPPSVGSSAITVSTGGVPVAGTVTLSSNGTALTFKPGSALSLGTPYTVTVGGFTDLAGNAVQVFSSTFTTGTVTQTTGPAAPGVTPVNGASGVAVTSSAVLTFAEAVNPATVSLSTVPIEANGVVVAGTHTVNGTTATFAPLTPFPGGATVKIYVESGVQDLAGNAAQSFNSSFTTASTVDTTPPTVVSVMPANGATGIGLNGQVVITFSKSLNPNTLNGTLNGTTLGLLANGSKLPTIISVSADNRVATLTLSAGTLPPSSIVTVIATAGVQDLSGNALANFESSFTTAAALDTTHPSVVTQRPANLATGVPLSTSVVLYLNEAMNASTVNGALYVSQNGVLVNGTTQVTDSGEVVQFTPSTPWQNNALIQVFLEPTTQDANGNSLNSYQGSFTTVANLSQVAPNVIITEMSPADGAGAISTSLVIDIPFNETLNSATVNTTTVTLNPENLPAVGTTVTLVDGGTVIQVVPNAPLTANTQYFVQMTTGIQGTNGLALAATGASFTTGAGPDTVAPAIMWVSPAASVNVGDNAQVLVVFSKPVNPLTVSATTVTLTGGGTTAVPDSISFSNSNQTVVLVPHAPLPDITPMTLTINGVTDVAGIAVPPQTTTFTTGTGPVVVAPAVVSENPFAGATMVPLNAPIMLQTSEPIAPGTVNQSTFAVGTVAGTYTVSADGQTISFLPSAPLATNQTFSVGFENAGIMDLSGNRLACAVLCNFTFTAGTTADTTAPTVLGVSPANGLTVPINAQVVVQFSEPVNALSLNQVTLSGRSAVPVISTLTNGNQTLTLAPVVPLNPSTTYTINISGVTDLSGNALTAPPPSTFTTGMGADLTPPTATATPANGVSGVLTNSVIRLQFSKQVDPLTVTTADFLVLPQGGAAIQGSVTVSAGGLTATFTPSSALNVSTTYNIAATNLILDLEGQSLQPFATSTFTTGTQ